MAPEPLPAPRSNGGSHLVARIPFVFGALVVVFFAVMAFCRRWMSDDGFINLRVVQNLLDGNGPVFNLSERVEAFTSPLWILLVSFLGAIGVRLEHAAVYLSMVLSVAGLALAAVAASMLPSLHRAPGAPRKTRVPFGVGIYAALAVSWDYATSGLETGLTILWLGASFLLLVRVARHRQTSTARFAGLALLLGLGPLIRPELTLYTLTMGIAGALVARENRGGRLGVRLLASCVVAMVLLPLAYQIFRMGYFAALTPNTAIAKEAFSMRWIQGGNFLWNTFGVYLLYVPFAAVAFITFPLLAELVRRRAITSLAVLGAPMIGAVLHGSYVSMIGGGFMHGRLLLPAVFAFLMPFSAALPARTALRARRGKIQLAIVGILSLWMIACAAFFRVDRENVHGIGDERGWYSRMAKTPNPVRVEDYEGFKFYDGAERLLDLSGRTCPAGPGEADCKRLVYVDAGKFGRLEKKRKRIPIRQEAVDDRVVMVVHRVAIGMTGYRLGPGFHVVDHAGLSDPIAARLELEERSRPGHEKKMSNQWMVGRFGDVSKLSDQECLYAHEAVGCGELRDLLDAVTRPMSADLFFENIRRSFALQRLKIPRDPAAAMKAFCTPEA